MKKALQWALKECPNISINPNVMTGYPCILGTRISVGVIMACIREHGSIKKVQKLYPQLSIDEIKEAITFAERVLVAQHTEEESA